MRYSKVFKVLFHVLKSQLGSAPKYLCYHMWPLFSLLMLPLSAVSALPNAIIFPCLVLGQPWPTLGPLLLFFRHYGINSLLLFVHLFYLLPFPHLSLALSLRAYLFPGTEMHWKRICSAYTVRSKRYINIYIQYNKIGIHEFATHSLCVISSSFSLKLCNRSLVYAAPAPWNELIKDLLHSVYSPISPLNSTFPPFTLSFPTFR